MARSSSTTLMVALAIVVAAPIASYALTRAWRTRALMPLPPDPTDRSAPAPTAAPPPVPEPPRPKPRPVDALLIGVFEGSGVADGADLLPDGPRVDLATGEQNRRNARVDLDRDGTWDELWTIALDSVVREVSPADDGTMTERFEWMGGGWVPAPSPAP